MKTNETLKRTFVHVYFEGDGCLDEVRTFINFSPEDAAKYYLGRSFPFGGYDSNGRYCEYMLKAWRVSCHEVQELQHNDEKGYFWNTTTKDARESYRLQGGQIVKTAV